MLRNVSSHTASDGPAIQENIFLVNFEDLVDKIIHCESILLELLGVFRLVAVKAVTWVLHCENADSKTLLEAIEHVVAHAKILRVGMEVQHDLARSFFSYMFIDVSSCYELF